MADENETAAQSSFRYDFREAENSARFSSVKSIQSIGVQGRLATELANVDLAGRFSKGKDSVRSEFAGRELALSQCLINVRGRLVGTGQGNETARV
jgi:hypothetical protein